MMDSTTSRIERATPQVPELGRLKAATERVARASTNLENFLSRFHGPHPAHTSSAGGTVVEDHYRNDLVTLFDQTDRLENAITSLDSIG